jgi:streptogramin lyase
MNGPKEPARTTEMNGLSMNGLSTFKRAQRRIILSAAMAALTLGVLVALIGASAASANGVPLKKGDVLAGVGNGNIAHFDPSGKLLDTLETTSGSTEDTGMCFDAASNLYSTNFEANTMSKFDSGGNLLAASFGSGFNEHPESCIFDGAGNMYVGQADGSHEVLKFDTSGKSLGSFKPSTESQRGTDWIDLASDGCTLHYTGESTEIRAFNVCTNTQLTAFATGLPNRCFAHRILADGSELVACTSLVEHVNAAGEVLMTYTPPGTSFLFALNVDPDGTSFWTANLTASGTIWRIDIASGKVLTEFSSGAPVDVAGLAVVGEITRPSKIELSPATAENPVGTTHTVTATVTENGEPKEGVTVTFTVTGANPQTGTGMTNAKGEATFTYKGEKAGTDTIVASFKDKSGKTDESNQATKIWTAPTGCAISDKKVSPFTDVATGKPVYAEDNLASTITPISPVNSAPEHLAVSGNGRFFALTGLTSVKCHDNTAYPLDGGNKFNTVSGIGSGTLGTVFGTGKPGYTARFEFSDGGDQPSGSDTGGDSASLIVYDGLGHVVWHVNGKFTTASQEETG